MSIAYCASRTLGDQLFVPDPRGHNLRQRLSGSFGVQNVRRTKVCLQALFHKV